MPGVFDEAVPVLAQCHIGSIPVRLRGLRLRDRWRHPGVGLRGCCNRVPVHRFGPFRRIDRSALQRQCLLAFLRLLSLLLRFPFGPMHVAHRGRAPVAPRPGMEFFEGVKILATYSASFGEQGGKIAG